MDNVTFETQDLRIRIEDNVARIDQRNLSGETVAGNRSQRIACYAPVAGQYDPDFSS